MVLVAAPFHALSMYKPFYYISCAWGNPMATSLVDWVQAHTCLLVLSMLLDPQNCECFRNQSIHGCLNLSSCP
ncbi:hypothetical protein AXF42_Ash019739 [Apostasia shenzhenica]|uniref:Uncharacterized protein n=1 Tax=Apostasia shenzhenica TaxID=1088818 RepID=A0A2H9ZRS6_9ASPA|nr:hypothetical protein AXF42_Ash019739 [Apostasia shenzhenica]